MTYTTATCPFCGNGVPTIIASDDLSHFVPHEIPAVGFTWACPLGGAPA